jgi:PAS domain S-box-containing protein
MSAAPPSPPTPHRFRRPNLWLVLVAYWAAFITLHLAASVLSPRFGGFLWCYPAALSVLLLLVYGPKVLPAVILAPLPVDLSMRSMGLGPGTLIALSAIYGCAYAVGALAFQRLHLSSRLRRVRDVGGFLVVAALCPLLAYFLAHLLFRASGLPHGHPFAEGVMILLYSHMVGTLTLGPALLLWIRPLLTLGWTRPDSGSSPLRTKEFLLQAATLSLSAMAVARFSEPGTLHLKYLLFLPMTWMAMRGLRAISLGFPILSLALAASLLGPVASPAAVLGIQAFLVVLFGMALFLGSAVEAHNLALLSRQRGSRRLNQLVATTGAIAWEMDLETGRCGYLGMKIEALLGVPQEVWRRRPFWAEVIHPDDLLAFLRFLLEVSQPGGNPQLEFRLRTPEGREHWVRAAGGLEPGFGQGRVMGFLFDIHAHKHAEQNALRTSLKEKDLLLREIHHRVKNNLQVVSSLLRLQAASQADPALQRALQEAQERIHAIALIHQKLKHSPDFSKLDLPGYVRTLAERLVRSYASVPALIDLRVRVEEVEIGPDAPVPLGLILNELVANALQHAFPAGEGGSLDIEIGRDAKGWVWLRVADSGQGLPESVDLDKGGLGFQLVRALTDQLAGVLELERRRGASFLLSFPPNPHHL